jgi:hypothetical protein
MKSLRSVSTRTNRQRDHGAQRAKGIRQKLGEFWRAPVLEEAGAQYELRRRIARNEEAFEDLSRVYYFALESSPDASARGILKTKDSIH